jgi:uncharacterized protein (DUF433 family)
MQTVITSHIYLDEEGRAWIDDTNTKIIEVVLDKLAYNWGVEEIHEQHPHLSLAQIHAALSYYYDHRAEIDSEIERQDKEIEALMEKAKDSPLRKRLESMAQNRDKGVQTVIGKDTVEELMSPSDYKIFSQFCSERQMSAEEAMQECLAMAVQIFRKMGFDTEWLFVEMSANEQDKKSA